MAPAGLRISVVIPVRNVQDYLPGCLTSILAQAGPELEVIAVDDASSDRSSEILAARARQDARLRVLRLDRPGGPGNARNAGLELATGDYVWYVDGDDLIADGAVGAIAARLAEDSPDVLLIDYEDLYPDGSSAASPGAALLRSAPAGTFTLASQPQLLALTMTAWSKVISRGFLLGVGAVFPAGIHEDVPVTCAMLLAAGRISALDRVCYRYRRRRPGSFMTSTSADHFAIFDAYRQVLDNCAKWQADAGAATTPALAAALFERAIWHYSTVLQTAGSKTGRSGGLVPRRLRRQFFTRMHADFTRYRPPGYRLPPGARGAKFRLIERGSYWTYELLEPLNRARVAARRWVPPARSRAR